MQALQHSNGYIVMAVWGDTVGIGTDSGNLYSYRMKQAVKFIIILLIHDKIDFNKGIVIHWFTEVSSQQLG